MYRIQHGQSAAPEYTRRSAYDYPDIPFGAIALSRNCTERQLAALQSALAHIWNAPASWSAQAPRPHLDLQDMGLVAIDSSARLIPPLAETVSLDHNPLLHKLPNNLPSALRWLSVRGNTSLCQLPQSLPRGLTIEVAGSGLTPEYLGFWSQRHPYLGVRFTHNGVTIDADPGAGQVRPGRRERGSWEARASRTVDLSDEYQPPMFAHADYERERYGRQYASARTRGYQHEHDEQRDIIEVTEYADSTSSDEASSAAPSAPGSPMIAGVGAAAIGMGDYALDSESDSETMFRHEQMRAFAELDDDDDDLARALEASLDEQAPAGEPAGQASAPGAEEHAAALAESVGYLAYRMSFWLGEGVEHMEESTAIARQCAAHLYTMEEQDEHGAKRRPAHEIIGEHYTRLTDFAQILDRIKDTGSFRLGNWEERESQRQKVADMLRLMPTEADLCVTVLAAMKEAARTCADALAAEGVDMMAAMCTTMRAGRENWTPDRFYLAMEQQLRRDKVRTLVGDIVKRMKKDYRAVLLEAIEKNHQALNATFFRNPGVKLSDLVGERHTVKRDGTIRVRDPDPDEKSSYANTSAARKEYATLQANKRIDDIEVLSLCQNKMQSRGLLSDVQSGQYTAMHSNSLYSEALNVAPAELNSMARKLQLPRAEVLAQMPTWDSWKVFLDRDGHLPDINNDPGWKRHQEELRTHMEALRPDLAQLIDDHAMYQPDAVADFALLTKLINTLGTPVITHNELLRLDAETRDAISFEDKKKSVEEGAKRLAALLAEAGAADGADAEPVAPAPPAAADSHRARDRDRGHERDAHRRRAGHASRRTPEQAATRASAGDDRTGGTRRRRGAERSATAAPVEPAQPDITDDVADPAASSARRFQGERLALLTKTMEKLTEHGNRPYEAAVLRKTEALVLPLLAPAAAAAPAARHPRRTRS